MDIVGAFDVHRKQITFDYIEMDSGEVHRGKIRPATRESLSPTVPPVRNDLLNTACCTLIEESRGCEDDQATLQDA
jgi:hypothetical protein